MINTEKTVYMSLKQSSNNEIRSSSGDDIKRVIDFEYLGRYLISTSSYKFLLSSSRIHTNL